MRLNKVSAAKAYRGLVAGIVSGAILLSAIASYANNDEFPMSNGASDKKATGSFACKSEFRLALDIGHTPELPGTLTARGRTEYEFNLKLATFVQTQLANRGYNNIRLIKMSGGLETLKQRVEIANNFKADLFLSIHHDSAQPKYFEQWVVDERTLD
jgi:N-acetylmuramoyl-L-alanine amidase